MWSLREAVADQGPPGSSPVSTAVLVTSYPNSVKVGGRNNLLHLFFSKRGSYLLLSVKRCYQVETLFAKNLMQDLKAFSKSLKIIISEKDESSSPKLNLTGCG